MTANYKKPPTEWENLSRAAKNKINNYCTEKLIEEVDRQFDVIEERFLKYACIVLHETRGFDRDECMRFLASWKTLGRRMLKYETGEEQDKWINARLGEFFPEFPEEWVRKMIGDAKGETK